jgi:hypothetical protein
MRTFCSTEILLARRWMKDTFMFVSVVKVKKSKAVPLHAMEVLGGRGGI